MKLSVKNDDWSARVLFYFDKKLFTAFKIDVFYDLRQESN